MLKETLVVPQWNWMAMLRRSRVWNTQYIKVYTYTLREMPEKITKYIVKI